MALPVVIPKEYSGTVTQKKELYANTFFLSLATPEPLSFTAGQYASFLIGNQRRPFSFAHQPGSKKLDFIIGTRSEGVSHDWIENLKDGDEVHFLAPYGRFVVEAGTRPLLFIASGTGLAPVRSQLQQILGSSFQRDVYLYFAHYDEERLFLQEEFLELEKQYQNFHYVPCLSKGGSTWNGKGGLVTEIIPSDIPNLSEYSVYVCGSPSIVTAAIAMLERHHVPKEQIHFERFT